jgi:hypothetical protein
MERREYFDFGEWLNLEGKERHGKLVSSNAISLPRVHLGLP